jgi:hypothetical protein
MQFRSLNLLRCRFLVRASCLAALCLLVGQCSAPLCAEEPAAQASPEPGENTDVFPQIVPPLPPEFMARVRDSRGLPVLSANLNKVPGQEFDEIDAYLDAVHRAHSYSAAAFANSARQDVTYAHLWNEPHKYRGQVVHVEGRLKRVRRFDPGMMLSQAGVQDLYEGWIFAAEQYGANPVCTIFTDLPDGVPVAEDVQVSVAFDGYFFKKYRYKAGDSKPGEAREVPLLIGRAPVVQQSPAAATVPVSSAFGSVLTGLLALVASTLALGLVLHWWFRRADRRVQVRLAAAQQREFVAPTGDGSPGGTAQDTFELREPGDN